MSGGSGFQGSSNHSIGYTLYVNRWNCVVGVPAFQKVAPFSLRVKSIEYFQILVFFLEYLVIILACLGPRRRKAL